MRNGLFRKIRERQGARGPLGRAPPRHHPLIKPKGNTMNVSGKTSFAAGALMALILGSSTAYAATGGDFRLGAVNSAGHMSTLQSTHGPALMLKSGEETPPFQVNRGVMVPKLNSSMVGGKHETAFALKTGGVAVITAEGIGLGDADSNGVPEEVSAVATCPAGTVRTGGGATDQTTGGVTWSSAPSGLMSWQVAVTTNNVDAQPEAVKAMVMCYNPRGPVDSRTVLTTRSQVFADLTPGMRDKLLGR